MKLLVIRFSALGDVAMTVPVLITLAQCYPNAEITILSKKACAPLFEHMPTNVHFVGADFHNRHAGRIGRKRLLNELNLSRFDAVADLHGVLRSWLIDLHCLLKGKRVACIRKGRFKKWQLTRRYGKRLQQLPTTFERYESVLRRVGLPIITKFTSIFDNKPTSDGTLRIGIAPFAKHCGKIYPMALMEQVIAQLSEYQNTELYIFGRGSNEEATIRDWCSRYTHTHSATHLNGITHELELMNRLDVMLSMDSANMHLSSLVNTRVVSVWGATHPQLGFLGWRQSEYDAVQLPLACRPCSTFGNKSCHKGTYECLKHIDPKIIVNKILTACDANNTTITNKKHLRRTLSKSL